MLSRMLHSLIELLFLLYNSATVDLRQKMPFAVNTTACCKHNISSIAVCDGADAVRQIMRV